MRWLERSPNEHCSELTSEPFSRTLAFIIGQSRPTRDPRRRLKRRTKAVNYFFAPSVNFPDIGDSSGSSSPGDDREDRDEPVGSGAGSANARSRTSTRVGICECLHRFVISYNRAMLKAGWLCAILPLLAFSMALGGPVRA